MLFIISVLVIVTTADMAHDSYQYRPKINGWVKINRVATTWPNALQRCMEEGAILASPINEDLTYELQTSFGNTPFFIGTNSRYNSNIYVSLEGVLLDKMPLIGMFDSLNPEDGLCLIMNDHNIRAVPCEARYPYACYKQRKENVKLTKCGTFDPEYKFGSCYKYNYQRKAWTEAYSTCVAEGGYLAVLNNKQETDILLKNVNNLTRYITMGVLDWVGKGSWMSVHGEAVEQLYNVWEDGVKPTNSSGMCAYMHPTTGDLKDFSCLITSFFICEKDPTNVLFPIDEY